MTGHQILQSAGELFAISSKQHVIDMNRSNNTSVFFYPASLTHILDFLSFLMLSEKFIASLEPSVDCSIGVFK